MNIQQVLFHLSLRNDRRREEIVQWLRSHPSGEFAQQARLGKVAPAILATLEVWQIEMPALAALRSFNAELASQRAFYELEMQALQESGEFPPQSILILKGRAIQRWYPGDFPPRQSFDLDFVIEDEEQFWQVGRWLVNRGYTLPMMGAAYPERMGQKDWHFILTYEKTRPGAPPGLYTSLAMIEMLQGVTSLSLRQFFDLRPIIARARTGLTQSPCSDQQLTSCFVYPTREDCLLTLLVEISERKLEIRDAVDFSLLLEDREKPDAPALDWEMVSRTIAEASLTIQFLRLASYYTSVSGASLPPEVERTCRQWQRQYIYWKWIARSPELNLVAFSYARRFRWTTALKEVLLNFWEAARDNALLMRLPFLRRPETLPYDRLDDQQTLARLLYLAPDQGNACHWGRGKGGELLLRTPVGIFLATRSIDFTRTFLENMARQLPEDWTMPLEESQKS